MRPAAGGVGKQLWANHKPGHAHPGCANLRISEGPAHINAKDYTATALQRHGFTVETEHSTGRGTVLDVAVLDSPVKLGLEAQFYPMKERDLRTRTTKSFNGGFTTAWMPGSNQLALSMGHSVPMLRPHTAIDWAAGVPRHGTVHVLSKRVMTLAPCTPSGPFTTCPETGRGVCGQRHPFFGVADTGFQVLDEVLGELAGGLTVPLMDAKGVVRLVSAQDRKLYEEHTGLSGEYRAASDKPERVTPPARLVDVECRAERTPLEDIVNRPLQAAEAPPSSPVLRPAAVKFTPSTPDICTRQPRYAVTFNGYHPHLVEVLKAVVPWHHRDWDKQSKQWRISASYADRLDTALRDRGCATSGLVAPQIPTPTPVTESDVPSPLSSGKSLPLDKRSDVQSPTRPELDWWSASAERDRRFGEANRARKRQRRIDANGYITKTEAAS
jgi:hypothetical protein